MTDSVRGSVDARPLSLEDLNTTVNHEPRILDLRLAEALGFRDPHKIRPLVRRHHAALARFGEVSATVAETGDKGGRPSKAFWLTKRQCLFLCTKSDAPHATEATIQMVEVFDAWLSSRTPALEPPARRRPLSAGAPPLPKDGRFLVVVRGGQVVTTVDVDGFCLLDGESARSVANFLRSEMSAALVPVALEALAARLAARAGADAGATGLRPPRWPSHPHIREREAGPGEILEIDSAGKGEVLPDGSLPLPLVGGGYRIFRKGAGR